MKVERVSRPVITPSAARGLLEAIPPLSYSRENLNNDGLSGADKNATNGISWQTKERTVNYNAHTANDERDRSPHHMDECLKVGENHVIPVFLEMGFGQAKTG